MEGEETNKGGEEGRGGGGEGWRRKGWRWGEGGEGQKGSPLDWEIAASAANTHSQMLNTFGRQTFRQLIYRPSAKHPVLAGVELKSPSGR